MKIIMIGGPYDHQLACVNGDEIGGPIPFFSMPQKFESITTALSEGISPSKSLDTYLYKLEIVKTSPNTWHYEYHYQGR
ncbi:hypothetical protein [Klebsiella quasipneumoniae]|uniref:hypothetical protein n=1 Tax=Klebsiella quasipneumoniae TaxID=1463165 RepID=UPI0024063768|nr:hypothetical protein [Klebsiella quasipneumoniae]MDG0556582.1 hypothetical protein [Klebsiella quasipneumoniae]